MNTHAERQNMRDSIAFASRTELIDLAVKLLGGTANTHRFTKGDTLRATLLAHCEKAWSLAPLDGEPAAEPGTAERVNTPAPTAPVASPPTAADPWAMFASMLEPHLAVKVDRSEIDSIIADRIAALTMPVTVEVKRADDTTVTIDSAHYLVPTLIQLVNIGEPVYLYGAPGAGKTHAVKQVADALGLRFGFTSLTPQSSRSELVGLKNPFNFEVSATMFYECVKDGGLFFFDEFDNTHPVIATGLNSLLENGYMDFHGESVTAHPNFRVVGAGNTAGRGGGRGHASRSLMDNATIDRFTYLEWGYDEAIEAGIVRSVNATQNGERWLGWVRDVRRYAATAFPDMTVGMRASRKGARLLAEGFSAEAAADMVVFKGIASDTKRNILSNCPLPTMVAVRVNNSGVAA